jgi:hypothetical protein
MSSQWYIGRPSSRLSCDDVHIIPKRRNLLNNEVNYIGCNHPVATGCSLKKGRSYQHELYRLENCPLLTGQIREWNASRTCIIGKESLLCINGRRKQISRFTVGNYDRTNNVNICTEAILSCIRAVPSSNLGQDAEYTNWGVHPGECWDSTWNYPIGALFQILSNSLSSNLPTIAC